MTYPPPGGENPQYQLQPEPQQPNDPYSQGYNTPPPSQYPPSQPQQAQQPGYPPPPPGYPQPQPTSPMMPPVNVQPGYGSPTQPPGYPPQPPGSVLPPPIPPGKQGPNLTLILGVVVGIVLILGVAAVLIVPGMLGDDEETGAEGTTTTSEAGEESSEPAEEETSTEPEETEPVGDELYSGVAITLTTDDDSGSCKIQEIDWDDDYTNGDGTIWQQSSDPGAEASYTDLIYDPCDIDTSTNTGLGNRFYGANDLPGLFFPAGESPTAEDCAAALADNPVLDLTFDPVAPDTLETGMTLCQSTDSGNLVVAEVTGLSPEDDTHWAGVELTATVYTP